MHGEKKGSLETKWRKTKEVVKKGWLEKEPGDGGGGSEMERGADSPKLSAE